MGVQPGQRRGRGGPRRGGPGPGAGRSPAPRAGRRSAPVGVRAACRRGAVPRTLCGPRAGAARGRRGDADPPLLPHRGLTRTGALVRRGEGQGRDIVRRAGFAAVPVALGAAVSAAAQEQPAVPERGRRRGINVSVVDRRGRPITDLDASVFTVRIDGQPRRVVEARLPVPRADGAAGTAERDFGARLPLHVQRARRPRPARAPDRDRRGSGEPVVRRGTPCAARRRRVRRPVAPFGPGRSLSGVELLRPHRLYDRPPARSRGGRPHGQAGRSVEPAGDGGTRRRTRRDLRGVRGRGRRKRRVARNRCRGHPRGQGVPSAAVAPHGASIPARGERPPGPPPSASPLAPRCRRRELGGTRPPGLP